jgi:glycosyltransferase involved in cell wall biosynthesis
MDKRKISICLTSYQRYQQTLEAFAQVVNDERVSEIILVDDCSDIEIYKKLELAVSFCPKVQLYRNSINLDCYANKAMSVGLATNEWVVIFDSDNVLTTDYLDKIYAIKHWNKWTVYQPAWAKPHFDFRKFEGNTITKENVALYFDMPMFSTMCNAMNYFVNRNMFLEVRQSDFEPHTADSILQNYNHLKNGGEIFVVPELFYEHKIHDGSHYKLNVHKTGDLYQKIENQMRQLR